MDITTAALLLGENCKLTKMNDETSDLKEP
jgi:hypothetical protein